MCLREEWMFLSLVENVARVAGETFVQRAVELDVNTAAVVDV
jgi:hypothetical protein